MIAIRTGVFNILNMRTVEAGREACGERAGEPDRKKVARDGLKVYV
jgi:hypothetical protein